MDIERQLTEVDLSRLAREIARDLKPIELLLEKLDIDADEWQRIQNNPIFTTRMHEEAQIWAANTKAGVRERVAVKAAVMIEELLIDACQMVTNADIPGAARVQALQFLAKMGQLGDAAMTKDDGSGRVQINIVIGGKNLQFDKDGPPVLDNVTDVVAEP